MTKTKMRIDPQRPGIIRWDDDPLTGILAGIRSAEIVEAVNAHDGLKAENDRMQAEIERLEAKVRKLLVENHELKRTRSEAEAAAEIKGYRVGAEEVRRQLRGVVGAAR